MCCYHVIAQIMARLGIEPRPPEYIPGALDEIKLVWLIICLLLAQYLSFSSTLMFPSMHHTNIHTF